MDLSDRYPGLAELVSGSESADLRSYWERLSAFLAAHPRLYCPACRKRVSPEMDTIIGFGEERPVRVVCPHCGVTSEVE